MQNPFYFRVLPTNAPFCDRGKEVEELKRHAENCANVVMFSPRRYGKTSLVKRTQDILAKEGIVAVYIDFYGAASLEEIASRMAKEVYRVIWKKKPLLAKAVEYLSYLRPVVNMEPTGMSVGLDVAKGKSGKELLEHTMEGLGRLIKESKKPYNIAIDEFQEIVELKEAVFIEGVLRSNIQFHSNASYFFIGSRRRILADMFNNRKRPFYKSAVNFPLQVLPEEDLVNFLIEQFKTGGKRCLKECAKGIADAVHCHPYYSQKISYHIYEISGRDIIVDDIKRGYDYLLADETPYFEMMLQGLGSRQIALLSAIAKEPTSAIFSQEYISNYGLGSIGTVQGAHKKLAALDYIEKVGGVTTIVDPIFREWLKKR